jgi:hypothetical protein
MRSIILFQPCKQAVPHLDFGPSSIAWEAVLDKGLRGSHFWSIFWEGKKASSEAKIAAGRL